MSERIPPSFRPQPEFRPQSWVRGVLGNQNRRRVLGPGCDRDDGREADSTIKGPCIRETMKQDEDAFLIGVVEVDET